MRLVLIGFQNSGKTTVGTLLAKRLDYCFFDSDQCLAAEFQTSIREIYQLYGEIKFRHYESAMIAKLTNANDKQSFVLATGGGSLSDANNIALLKQNSVMIYLATPFSVILARYQNNFPAYAKQAQLADLYAKRSKIYERECDYKITTINKNPGDIVEQVSVILECHCVSSGMSRNHF